MRSFDVHFFTDRDGKYGLRVTLDDGRVLRMVPDEPMHERAATEAIANVVCAVSTTLEEADALTLWLTADGRANADG